MSDKDDIITAVIVEDGLYDEETAKRLAKELKEKKQYEHNEAASKEMKRFRKDITDTFNEWYVQYLADQVDIKHTVTSKGKYNSDKYYKEFSKEIDDFNYLIADKGIKFHLIGYWDRSSKLYFNPKVLKSESEPVLKSKSKSECTIT